MEKVRNNEKQPYSKPTLVSYGNADELILGGTSAGNEGTGPQTTLFKP